MKQLSSIKLLCCTASLLFFISKTIAKTLPAEADSLDFSLEINSVDSLALATVEPQTKKCLIRVVPNCTDRTITLQAYGLPSGTPVLTTWSTGQYASSITVVPPGVWSYTPPAYCKDPDSDTDIELIYPFFYPPFEITGNDDNIQCVGESIVLSYPNYPFSFAKWTSQYGSGGDLNPYNIPGPGTFNLNVRDQYGCPFDDQVTIIKSPPIQPIIQGPVQICSSGKTATLTAFPPGNQFYWQNGETTQSITINEPGTYAVTATNSLGCSGEASWELASADIDTLLATVSEPAICPGLTSTLQLFGGPFTSVNWSNGAVGPKITVSEPGIYTAIATNIFGCPGQRQFVIDPLPTPKPTLNSPAICAGAAATLTVAGGNFANFKWSDGQNSPSISVSQPGNFAVTVADSKGCTGSTSTVVQASPAAVPTVHGIAETCAPATATLQANAGFATYQWTLPNGTTASTQNIEANQSGIYTLQVANAAGCTGSTTQNFTQNPLPNPTLTAEPYTCDGQIRLSANAGFANYQWSTGETGLQISTKNSGNFILTVTSSAGCTAVVSQSVSIPPAPATSIAGVSELCLGVGGQLFASGNFQKFDWSNGQTGAAATVTAAGKYTVTATDQFGCTATAERNIAQKPALQPAIAGPLQICTGSSGTFSAIGNFEKYLWSNGQTSSSISVAAAGNYAVTVSNSDGCTGTASQPLTIGTSLEPQVVATPYLCDGKMTISAGQGFQSYLWASGQNTPTITATAAGNYEVTVADAGGCTGSGSLQVQIPSPPQVQILGQTKICAGETANLAASPNFQNYFWSNGQNTPTIAAATSGIFTLTVSDQFGCTATADFNLEVKQPVQPVIVAPAEICQNESAQLFVSQSFEKYAWSNGATTPEIQVSQTGNFALTVTDADGCTAQTSAVLVVNPLPQVSILQNPYDCDGSIDLAANGSFAQYSWSNGIKSAQNLGLSTGNYTLTVADAKGCTATATTQIAVPSPPQVSILTAQPFCAGGTGQLQVSGNFSNYAWSNGAMTTGITVAAAGNYAVTVADQFGCTAEATAQVEVLPLPQPTVSGPAAICAGATGFELQVAGGSFSKIEWSNGGSDAATQVSFPGNFQVTVTDANGCRNVANFTIGTAAPPAATAGNDQILTCTEKIVQLDGSGSTTGASIDFQWFAPNGQLILDGKNLQIEVAQAGNYLLVVRDAATGCTAADGVAVSLSADLPQVNIAQPPLLTCEKTSLELDATGSSTGADFVCNWSASGAGSILAGATTLAPTVTGAGEYTLIISNLATGCTVQTSVLVAENRQPPAVQFATPQVLNCAKNSQTIQIQSVNSFSPNLHFAWTTVGGQFLGGQNLPQPLISAAGMYSVLVTDQANGCTSTATLTVAEDKKLPVVAVTAPQILTCVLKFIQLDASQSSSANTQFRWATTDGKILDGANTSQPTISEPGNYQLLVTDTTNGCFANASVLIAENVQPPVVSISAPQILTCTTPTQMLESQLISSFSQNLNYSWTTVGGQFLAGQNTPSPTIAAAGEYILRVTDAANGCTAQAAKNVFLDKNPPLAAVAPPQILTCRLTKIELDASQSSSGANFKFEWTTTDGNLVAGVNSPQPTVDAPGNYALLVSDLSNGCTAATTVAVSENIALPSVAVAPPFLLTCSRSEVDLSANFESNLEANWTTTNGQILSGATSAKARVSKVGTYKITVLNPADGCENWATVEVSEEQDKPKELKINLLPPDCKSKRGSVEFESVIGGVQPLLFSVDGGASFFDKKVFEKLAAGDYELVVMDGNGCEYSEPLRVPEPPVVAVDFDEKFELNFGDSLRLEPVLPAGLPLDLIAKVDWSPLENLWFEDTTVAARLRPFARPFKNTTFTLTIATPEGCTATARASVKVQPPGIWVPNVVKPVGSLAENAGFTIFSAPNSVQEIEKLLIFDRWGNHVFEKFDFPPNDASLGWQGDFRGEQMKPAVFVWWAEVLMMDGSTRFLEGEVTLVR